MIDGVSVTMLGIVRVGTRVLSHGFFKPRVKPPQSPILAAKRKMILTNCAACAAPLAHDAPRCVRCKVRYCDSTCQHDHWRRGHKQMCKKIHRGGNAEQYNADEKYKEAVAVAAEACADDTNPQSTTAVVSLVLV